MAVPVFVGAGTGGTPSADVLVSKTGCTAGNLLIVHALHDGGSGPVNPSGSSGNVNITSLSGTANASTQPAGAAAAFTVGSPTNGYHKFFLMRATANGTSTLEVLGTVDIYARMYEFSGVSSGTTVTTVIENGAEANGYLNAVGTAAAVTDTGVTTNGNDRLALQLVGVNDDNPLVAFTGMSGGTWAEAVAEFASATGTDGAVQLQTATMASAGTINGGSQTMAASDGWGVIGFALIPAASGTTNVETGYGKEGG